MGTLNNNSGNQRMHDGQKHYQHSNEVNRDHARSNPDKHQYKEHDETLTNDENFKAGVPKANTDEMDFRDKLDNLEDQNK